mmetsp:Transcript_52471/g.127060  ORF Transcript_52471/g.127060 Transcript_52471/m.127060 type:complete len:263 (-) Transcript_52471:131-919(-)
MLPRPFRAKSSVWRFCCSLLIISCSARLCRTIIALTLSNRDATIPSHRPGCSKARNPSNACTRSAGEYPPMTLRKGRFSAIMSEQTTIKSVRRRSSVTETLRYSRRFLCACTTAWRTSLLISISGTMSKSLAKVMRASMGFIGENDGVESWSAFSAESEMGSKTGWCVYMKLMRRKISAYGANCSEIESSFESFVGMVARRLGGCRIWGASSSTSFTPSCALTAAPKAEECISSFRWGEDSRIGSNRACRPAMGIQQATSIP